MTHSLTDERLCWLAVRDQVAARTQPNVLLRLLMAMGGGRTSGPNEANELANDKKGDYALIVDDLARELTADERRHLRATGQVPEWFMPRVAYLYAERRTR
jgi:hypothetical protein